MASLWESIVGSVDTGADVEKKLDTAFSNIDTDIEELQGNQPFKHSYDYATASDITVASDAYEEVVTLETPPLGAGTYNFSANMLHTLDSSIASAYFRFSLDNGVTWLEIRREPKDNTDKTPLSFNKPIVHSGGVFKAIIQARKENTADVMVIVDINAIFERKA